MEVVQLLEMSTNEGKNYGNRFFKFFYYDKFYLIDNLKVDVLFRILKIKTKNKDLTGKNTDYDAIQKEFLEAMQSCDMVIAKGQGNYESLCQESKPVYFLMTVKCGVIARMTGYPQGSLLCMRQPAE